jgi:hypothetical protein
MTEGDRIFKIWNLSGCGAREQWLVSLNMMVSKPVLHSQVSTICFLSLVEAKKSQINKKEGHRRSYKIIEVKGRLLGKQKGKGKGEGRE